MRFLWCREGEDGLNSVNVANILVVSSPVGLVAWVWDDHELLLFWSRRCITFQLLPGISGPIKHTQCQCYWPPEVSSSVIFNILVFCKFIDYSSDCHREGNARVCKSDTPQDQLFGHTFNWLSNNQSEFQWDESSCPLGNPNAVFPLELGLTWNSHFTSRQTLCQSFL